MTKPVTSVAVMTLYEEGRFELMDPVSKFIPEFANAKVVNSDASPGTPTDQPATVPAKRPITIRDLLTHSSVMFNGLPYCTRILSQVRAAAIPAAAGCAATVGDYYRFCQMLLNNGRCAEQRILSRKSVELMTSVHVPMGSEADELSRPAGFGLGFAIAAAPGQAPNLGSAGTFSWGGFFYTTFLVDPQEQLIAISMAQLFPAADVDWQNRFPVLVYQAIDD